MPTPLSYNTTNSTPTPVDTFISPRLSEALQPFTAVPRQRIEGRLHTAIESSVRGEPGVNNVANKNLFDPIVFTLLIDMFLFLIVVNLCRGVVSTLFPRLIGKKKSDHLLPLPQYTRRFAYTLLFLLTFSVQGILIYVLYVGRNYCQTSLQTSLLLLGCMLVAALFYLFNYGIMRGYTSLFCSFAQREDLARLFVSIQLMLGVTLLPLVLLITFTSISLPALLTVAFGIYLLHIVWFIIQLSIVFLVDFYGVLHIISYLCTLEIVPHLAAYAGVKNVLLKVVELNLLQF